MPRRSDAKYSDLADCIRRSIVEGVWAPGEKLPTWDDLCTQYEVGRPTLTRALAVLKREGFVNAPSTRGTYVTERPPHQNRYAMIFPSAPGRQGVGGWNLFWESLAMQALASYANGGPEIRVMFEVSPHQDCPAFSELTEDMAKGRIAGVFVINGGELINLKLAENIPHVHICGAKPAEGRPAVGVDWDSFYEKAARWMKEQGRRRIAILSEHQSASEACALALAKHKIKVPERWTLSMPGTYAEGARNLLRLLLSSPKPDRPDGLIITDDNLVSPALSGVIDEKVAVPDDLVVVAHCNSPGSPPPPLSVHRLGFDAGEVLQGALEVLRRQTGGKGKAPLILSVSATAEHRDTP